MTLCNMVVEAGGKNGVIPPDATTFNYVEVCMMVLFSLFSRKIMLSNLHCFSYLLQNRTSVPFQPVYSDGNARYNDNPMVPLCKYVFLIALCKLLMDLEIPQ